MRPRRSGWFALGVAVIGLSGIAAWAENIPVTNWALQAVDSAGHATLPTILDLDNNKVVIEGICLNNPEDMLAPSSQWQIFIQGEGSDLGGTAAWTGSFFYKDTPITWAQELARINASGFREGDRIRITGLAQEAAGKTNINERHTWEPDNDFTVELLQTGVGLPAPEQTTIAEMLTFVQNRLTGGERYQCRRIKLDNVHYVSGTWGSNQRVLIGDDQNNTMTLKLCNVNFGTQAPSGKFNLIGLGNQENGYTNGYEVWLTRADGIIPVFTITGTVALPDFGNPSDGVAVNVQLQDQSNLSSITNVDTTLDADGKFTITGIANGSYNIRVKACHWLAVVKEVTVAGSNVTISEEFAGLNGDASGDNAIDEGDFPALTNAWYSVPEDENWDFNADLNGDNAVDEGDFPVLTNNWYNGGDELPME